jgi:photosystem II stability/assembly factor-like uncharacterized protein
VKHGGEQSNVDEINAADTSKLFAATYGSGIFKSTDSGNTWTPCANTNLLNMKIVSLAMDNTGKLYAGSESGVFVSEDGCDTWKTMNAGLP